MKQSKENILFFTCFNERSIHMESSVLYFKNEGYNVFFLTTCSTGAIHDELRSKNIVCDEINWTKKNGIFYYVKIIYFLIKYSKKRDIDFIYSHLQIPNFVSSIARFFIKAKVFTVRHNSDVIELDGSKKEKIIEKIINKLSSHIIAISDKVKDQLVNKEGVSPKKIYRINNGYNFEEYESLSKGKEASAEIREKYKCGLLMVSPGRLINTKRHELTVKAMKELQLKGYDVQLLILGEGPQRGSIEEAIKFHKVQPIVHLLGYISNIADYLRAADMVVLLSESEASSNIVKEAGYFEKPVVVCENVGDFSDYIVNKENGFLVSKESPLHEFILIVESVIANREKMKSLGVNLKKSIFSQFDIREVGKKYEELQRKVSS